MAELNPTTPPAIDRSERPGYVGLLVALACVFVAAFAILSLLSSESAQPLILGLLALLAMAGVFFVFATAIGAVRFSSGPARGDLTRTIADSAWDGLIAVEPSGRVIYANERYLRLAGAENGGPDLRTVERLFGGGPEIAEAIYRLAQAGREGRSAVEEMRLTPALGGARPFGWYRVRVRPLPRGGGRTATLWSVSDVTADRERNETVFQELQHAVDYLDHAPAGFLSADVGGAVVYANATLAEWLGHDLASIGAGGLRLADLMPEGVAAMLVALAGAPGTSRTELLDIELRRRAGGTLPVRLHHRVMFGADGRPGPSRTLVLNRSAAAAIGAEEDGQRAAEVRFARFFNASPLGVATLDAARRITGANPAFLRLFGAGASGAGGAEIGSLVADPDRARLVAALTGAVDRGLETMPIEVTLADDAARSARLWFAGGGEGGEAGSAILFALDMTEQRSLEQQFAQAQKMQAIGQLAGGVAHDFNNVLQAIIGYCDLLLASHTPTDPSFQDLMQIKQNANRAASLVRQLLAFSRRQTLRPETVKLGEALSDLSLLLKRLLGERTSLDVRQGRDLWFVKADVNQLEQVIINLVVNARDAMPDGGTVTIGTRNVDQAEAKRLDLAGMPEGEYVRIDVTDTGTGIEPALIDKIFEPFFTTKELGKGTGLGLSTVFGIVKQSGGFIYVESALGEGTTFAIYLPRYVPEQEPEPKIEIVAAKPAPDMTGQGTVLLVEDEDAVRAVNARALSARGYTVLQAASGVEALEIVDARDVPVDLVVSDVVMPEMDGPTLLGELRKRDPKLRIVFVSGYAEDAFAKHLPEGETFTFLPKPFSLKQLVETVKQAIAQ